MGLWSRLFGSSAPSQDGGSKGKDIKPGNKKPDAKDLLAQREALAKKLLTPERQARLAEAMQVQAAKQRLHKSLGSDQGQRQAADALRRMLNKD